MFDTSTETCHENVESHTQPEDKDTKSTDEAKELRRGERTRTLTEKGTEFREERLKTVRRRYRIIYERWRYHARIGKEILTDEASEEELNELIGNMEGTCRDVKAIYEELRRIETPEPDLRRRVDTCVSLSEFIILKAEKQLQGCTEGEEEPWPDVGSILDSTGSLSRPLTHRSHSGSTHSTVQSAKRNEAAAEAAASQEVLAVLNEQEREVTELQRLEAEDKQRLAQFEAENLARQQAMQDKRRRLERLEEVKKLKAARARVKVYDQVGEHFEANVLQDVEIAGEPQVLNPTRPPFIPQAVPVTQMQTSSDLVNALAEAISASRLPTPEPALFIGDPLKFKDWRLSFETLIDRKSIPRNEKLYYLRK